MRHFHTIFLPSKFSIQNLYHPQPTQNRENHAFTGTEKANGQEDKNTVRLPRQYMPKHNGAERLSGYGEQGRACRAVRDRLCRHKHRGDRQSASSRHFCRAAQSRYPCRSAPCKAANQNRCHALRLPHRNGHRQHPQYAQNYRRRRQNLQAFGVCGYWQRRCRPLVHGRFRCDLRRCHARLRKAARKAEGGTSR